ncbi:helix-turn-helix domain-containing protein [Paenibacillus sanguinis]|uniref:helix-turn-helix domain-containing protein n=1 Tax=Paenibacillus sanguinis TaxID=225906 RepID=UPI00036C84BA|nr:helix-turn-helix transcriptional regulator [Paenibacillus sanguinis]
MEPETTIRQQLKDYLNGAGLTLQQFSDICGINAGTVSAMLSGQRQISMHNLDRLTMGMGLAEGSLYEVYLEDCLLKSSPDWRRMGPFIHRCAELNKLDCIERLVQALADHLAYIPLLFDMAELLWNEGKRDAAALLYLCIVECEKYQHSERLALSRYRLFKIELGADQERNLRAVAWFEEYVDRLDESNQLDAIKDLADVYASLHRWDRVQLLAEELERKAAIQRRHRPKRKGEEVESSPSRELLFYLLYAYLLMANVCDAREEYERALQYVNLYSHGERLDIEVLNEAEEQIVKQFYQWGQGNACLYRLMSGEVEALAGYVEYITHHVEESIPAMYRILQAANRFSLNVDHLLEHYGEKLVFEERSSRLGTYNAQIVADQYIRYVSELAYYHFGAQRYESGFGYLFEGLELAIRYNHESMLIHCVRLFERFRHGVSESGRKQYKKLLCEVQTNEEKKLFVAKRA